jgi:hypothetical protein
LDIIWEVAGNLVQEVKLRDVYHNPETGRMNRTYDVFFITGYKILFGKTAINELLRQMDVLCEQKLNVAPQSRTTIVKKIVPHVTMQRRTKLRSTNSVAKDKNK